LRATSDQPEVDECIINYGKGYEWAFAERLSILAYCVCMLPTIGLK
jgi:hypothetical protein